MALTIAVLIKTYLVSPFFIPSNSMVPTILPADKIMVNKLSYRMGDPHRGDIIVFHNPSTFGDDNSDESIPEKVVRNVLEAIGVRTGRPDDFIKRIIGLPGDTLEIRDEQVYINGDAITEDYLPPGVHMPDFERQTIPQAHFFVMGDNRDNSIDSRSWGLVPEEEIVGEAFVRIWPIDRLGAVD